MKKAVLAVAAGAILLSGVVTAPAHAVTIKNGVACTKANATTKIGTKTYKCAKNPYVTPTKRTWTLKGCLDAYALYKNAQEEYDSWKDLAKLAGPDGQKTLDELQASIVSLEKTMKTVACKKGA